VAIKHAPRRERPFTNRREAPQSVSTLAAEQEHLLGE
jgi:hypothetical protein